MDRMLVVVFDSENKAYEGKRELLQLDNDGSIGVYGYTIVSKNADGTAKVKEDDDAGPLGTLLGTALGSLVGLIAGPAGVAAGAAIGLGAGAAGDLDNARVADDFVDDITKTLEPNKVALVAEIDEDGTTPVDTRMEVIGGRVFRRALSDANEKANQDDISAIQADIAQMKAEHAQAKADRKAKLQERINHLDSKLQAHLMRAKERREGAIREAQAKANVLKKKAERSQAKAA